MSDADDVTMAEVDDLPDVVPPPSSGRALCGAHTEATDVVAADVADAVDVPQSYVPSTKPATRARLAIVTMGRRAARMGCGWVSFMYHRPDDPGGPPDEARVKGEPNARGGGRASLAPLSLFRLAEDLAP